MKEIAGAEANFSGSQDRLSETVEFLARIDEVAEIYRLAFQGAPWLETLSIEEVLDRIKAHSLKPGFRALIKKSPTGNIVGSLWYDTPRLEDLRRERGEELASAVEKLQTDLNISDLVFTRETIVHPSVQGGGIGSGLRQRFLEDLAYSYFEGVLVLTRMRDDNHPIIKIAENMNYIRTGVRVESTQASGTFHEYWYRHVFSSEITNG